MAAVQVNMASVHSHSSTAPSEQQEQGTSAPLLEAASAPPPAATLPARVITRSVIQTLPEPPPFESLPMGKKKSAAVQASSSTMPAQPPQGQVASAYMAGGNATPTLEDVMAKFAEMQAHMARFQTDLEQVKASGSQEPRPPAREDEYVPPPPIHIPPMAPNFAAGQSRPFMMHPAHPRSQDESLYQDSLPSTPHGGIQRDELE